MVRRAYPSGKHSNAVPIVEERAHVYGVPELIPRPELHPLELTEVVGKRVQLASRDAQLLHGAAQHRGRDSSAVKHALYRQGGQATLQLVQEGERVVYDKPHEQQQVIALKRPVATSRTAAARERHALPKPLQDLMDGCFGWSAGLEIALNLARRQAEYHALLHHHPAHLMAPLSPTNHVPRSRLPAHRRWCVTAGARSPSEPTSLPRAKKGRGLFF